MLKLVFYYVSLLLFYINVCNGYNNDNKSQCGGVLVKSLCDDNVTTKWNNKNVDIELKLWINSLKQGDKTNSFLKKKLLMERKSRIIRYISNINCVTNRSKGIVWQTAGAVSANQFHDGFLYGKEDKAGNMTGFIYYIFSILIPYF